MIGLSCNVVLCSDKGFWWPQIQCVFSVLPHLFLKLFKVEIIGSFVCCDAWHFRHVLTGLYSFDVTNTKRCGCGHFLASSLALQRCRVVLDVNWNQDTNMLYTHTLHTVAQGSDVTTYIGCVGRSWRRSWLERKPTPTRSFDSSPATNAALRLPSARCF